MKTKNFLSLFFSVVFSLQNVFAQTYCMPVSGSQVNYTNSGTFYDSGCSPNNYTNNENAQMIFCPTSSCMVTLTFVSISLADNTDILRIYSGSVSANALVTYSGPLSVTSQPTVMSTDVSGCLTAWFQSGSSGIASGWEATIGCQSPTGISENQFSGSLISSGSENNSLNLTLPSPQSLTLHIFSVDGKKVSQKDYSLPAGQHQLRLPTENLSQGIYFVRVETENGNVTKKIIKQ